MPSNKPIIQVVVDEEIKTELLKICEIEDRTISNMVKQIIKEYIAKYNFKDNK